MNDGPQAASPPAARAGKPGMRGWRAPEMAPPRWLTPRRSIHLLGASFIAITLGLFALLAWQQYRESQRDAVQLAASLADILAGHAARLFDSADVLANLGMSYAAQRGWEEIALTGPDQSLLYGMLGKSEYMHAFWLVDQKGVVRLTASVGPESDIDPVARKAINDTLEAGESHVVRRLADQSRNRSVLIFARRFTTSEGVYRGSVQIAIDPNYFETFYQTVRVRYPVAINLFRTDLAVLVRHPKPAGPDIPLAWPDPSVLQKDSNVGVIDYLTEGGRERRFDVYRRVSPVPVYVGVGFAHFDVFKAWATETAMQGAFVLTILVGVAFLLSQGVRSTRREERALADLGILTGSLERQVETRTSELKDSNTRLTALLAEKEVLVREVNHRVKNSLQLISSLLEMQSHHTENPAVREQLGQASRRVRTVARMHQRLYLSEKADVIDFDKYLRGLCADLGNSLAASGSRRTVVVNADSAELSIETAISLGLVVAELVTNSIKYAYPDGDGTVEVDFHVTPDGAAHLAVSDRGVGLLPDFNPAANRGLGMRLVNAMVRHHDGSLKIDRAWRGARFEVTFPPPQTSEREPPELVTQRA